MDRREIQTIRDAANRPADGGPAVDGPGHRPCCRLRSGFSDGAFSLVETTLAIGVLAFSLVILVSLLPTGMQMNQVFVHQTHAGSLLAGIETDIETARQLGLRRTPFYGIDLDAIPASGSQPATYFLGEDGTFLAADGENPLAAAEATLRVSISKEDPAFAQVPAYLRIQVTWPAEVEPGNLGLVTRALVETTGLVPL